ncbi:MAG: hypothetical protein PHU85_13605 [Phycisphaerae bacterium]|nr:hypothetical protein [Phycisphaerae bacterium]
MTAQPPAAENRLQAFPEGLPAVIRCAGGEFRFVRQFKHDFFAATGLYAGEEGQVVLKIQRRRPYFGLRLGWLGAWLTRHEAAIYRELADLPGVPGFVDFHGPTGFIHEFAPGRPLDRREPVCDTFFDELADLLSAVHARGIAYVDLNKRQNILVGADGRPCLIDFQISYRLGRRGGELPRAILAMLQRQDWYHFAKHKRRCRPDLMTPADIERSYRPDAWGRIHRIISRPYFVVRRWILDRMHLPRGDEAEG